MNHLIVIHILLATAALGTLGIAAIQAITIAFQARLLKGSTTLPSYVPPIQTMQKLLLKIIWAGFFLLSITLIAAIYFLQLNNSLALSKLVVTGCTWLLYAGLLYGQYKSGWSRDVLTFRTIIGVGLLTLVYLASKL